MFNFVLKFKILRAVIEKSSCHQFGKVLFSFSFKTMYEALVDIENSSMVNLGQTYS